MVPKYSPCGLNMANFKVKCITITARIAPWAYMSMT